MFAYTRVAKEKTIDWGFCPQELDFRHINFGAHICERLPKDGKDTQ